MMGTQGGQGDLYCYRVDLEARVRADHLLRAVRERVDFSFVRAEVAGFYGHNGQVSVDPAVIMKMMFLLFLDDVKSERELMRILPERLDYLWFLGYGLDAEIPDHSVLSKARARWGLEVFESLFVRIVHQCVQAGLVGADKIHVDSSLIDANASTDSVVKGCPALIAALKAVYRAQSNKLGEPAPPDDAPTVNQTMFSTTDPDAALARHGSQQSRPRYKTHRVVDDAQGVITALTTTPGDVHDDAPLMDLVAQHETHTASRVGTVVADHLYGTVDNFRACVERGIRSHMADLGQVQSPSGLFPVQAFDYDDATDTYRCPAGQTLHRRGHDAHRRRTKYTAAQGVCDTRPLRAQCTRARPGTPRNIARHHHQAAVDAARRQSHSRAAIADRIRRRWRMEGSFADAANQHGLKRARWRRLHRQQIQDYLIAAAQNVRLLLRHARIPRRAAALALKAEIPRAQQQPTQRPQRQRRHPITPQPQLA